MCHCSRSPSVIDTCSCPTLYSMKRVLFPCSCFPLWRARESTILSLHKLWLFMKLRKMLLFYCFWKSNFNMARIWKKKVIFDLLFTFLVITEKTQKNPSEHILLTYIYFAHPIPVFAFQIVQKLRIHDVWFLFHVTHVVDSYSRHFGVINEYQNGVRAKLKLEQIMYYWYLYTFMPNL